MNIKYVAYQVAYRKSFIRNKTEKDQSKTARQVCDRAIGNIF